MYSSTHSKSMDQPSKVVNPARGQLNRENQYLPVPVRAEEFGLAGRVRPSRPASACSFSILRLNLVLTREIPPDFRGGVHFFIPPYAIGSVPSLSVHAIAYRRRLLPRVRRHRASNPQGSPVTGAVISGHLGPTNVRLYRTNVDKPIIHCYFFIVRNTVSSASSISNM